MRSFTYFMRVTFMLYFFLLYTTMNAWAQSTDFSSFSLGTVHYQGPGGTTVTGAGYTIPSPYGSLWTLADEWGFQKTAPVFDEEVKDDGTGNKVWRFSNAVTSGSFSFQPNSPNSPLPAGETTASLWNDRGPIHSAPTGPGPRATAASKYFHGGFRFKSATGAAQPGLSINISPTARQSDRRNSFLSITDNGSTGFNIGFVGTGISGTFPATTTIASNLSYAAWHQVDIYIEFVDGLNADGSGNDIVLVYLDGVLVVVGTTWETFYRTATPTRPIGAVDALMFRASGTAAPGTLGNGIYFDDVVYNNTPLPTPGPVNVYSDATETTLLSNHFSIQAGVNAAVSGNSIRVDAGTYNENVLIDKNNLILHSTGGKAITTIKGMTTPGAGAVMVANGVNGVTIGQPNKGFTIIGFDGNGAIESAALYLLGAHTNITIEDNEIRADGDHGLLSNLNAAIDGIYIKGNMFTGKTFLGAAPEGCGFPNPPTMPSQFSLGNNYPRQLVTMGGGGGVTLSKNVYFLNNTITGTAGGFNADPACAAYGQGNNLVTIDVIGCTISGNIFNGVTTRFSNSLRTRGPGTSIYCNTFFNGGLGSACGNIFLGSATVLGGGASPNTLAGIAAANGFPGGGAYLTPDNAASYIIYRDVAQATAATTIPPLLGAGQVANAAATVLNCPVLNVNTGLTYATIQGAISSPFTLSGHTIQVGAGTYNENVVINKSLTLKGANYNVSCKGSRGAESVINGVLGSNSAAVSIESDGVTLNGFKITNPLGSFGVFAKGRNNTDVQYNVIDDVGNNISGQYPSYGIYMLRGSTAHTTNVNFSNNCVSNIRGGENSSLTGAAAKANNGSAVGIGAGDSEANFDISGLTIEGNIIDDISACISAFADGGKGAYGVIINVGAKPANIGKAVSPLVTNNEITDLEGLWAHGVGLEGETPGAMVLNNIIHGLTDHKGNTDAIGVLLESNDGAATVQINNNSLTNMAYAVVNLMPPAVNATCNWYGTTSHPAIALLVAGNLVYIPYLASGTDGSGLVGFQPTATCTGGIPQLNTTINGVTVNSINDGNDDLAAFSVCPGTNNILFNLYADANGLVHPNLRVYQTLTTSNVSVPFCITCSATMAAFTGASGTAALINPAMAGTLVMRFKAWIDLNTDDIVDPGEPQGDWIQYTMTIYPKPVLRQTYNTVQVTANNDGTDDTGSFTVCSSLSNNVFLTEISDLQLITPTNRVKVEQVIIKTNVNMSTAANGVYLLTGIGPLPLGRTATLINPAMSGTVEIKRRAFYDGNNNNQIDAGECPGDWIVYTVHVDGQAPTIVGCPPNQFVNNSLLCGYLVLGGEFDVSATDDLSTPALSYTLTGATIGSGGSSLNGVQFNLGVTTVTWTATDDCNNTSQCVFTVTVHDPLNTTDFIIYAEKEAKFGEQNDINGDVGVTAANGKAEFKKNSTLDPYKVIAKNIHVQMPATVNNKFFVPATGGPNPPFILYSGGGLSGNHNQTVNGTVPAGNFKNLTIKKGVTATVNGNNYGKVKIEEGATVTFTATSINMEELEVGKGKKDVNTTNVIFSNPANVMIKDKVKIEEDCNINVGGPKVIFYLGDSKKDEENFEVKGDNSVVTLNIMIPNGKLKVNGGARNGTMNGWFIVEKLESDGKNTTWNRYDCGAPRGPVITKNENRDNTPVMLDKGLFQVRAYPNPTSSQFVLQVNSGSNEPVTVKIYDAAGRVQQVISNMPVNATKLFGSELRQGIYFAEVMQGSSKQTLKLLKIE